jgi:hypothetical protein
MLAARLHSVRGYGPVFLAEAGVYAALAGLRSFDNGLSYAIEPTRGDHADSRGRPRKSPA